MRQLNEIIVHCAATREGRHHTVDEIRSWHKQRGWSDIGYHYVVYLDGTVKEGRPLSKIGAHVRGSNTGTIGICYVGGVAKDGKTPKDTRTEAQKRSLNRLLRDLLGKYPTIKKISGHNQYAAKACPSFDAREEYRHLVDAVSQPTENPPDDRIRYLQKLLALSGHYSGQHDGIAGPETRLGVEAFQQSQGLKLTGEFDVETVAALRLIETPVSKQQSQIIQDVAAEDRISTTELGAAAVSVGTAAQTAREVTSVVNSAKDTVSSLVDLGPWLLLSLLIIGVGVYIWRERRKKRNAARAVL